MQKPSKPETPSQLDKFKEAARALECDEGENALDEKLKKIVPPPKAADEMKEDKPA